MNKVAALQKIITRAQETNTPILAISPSPTEEVEKFAHFHEGEIFYARLGENIGFEQCGKGEQFLRPILVIRKFNQRVFWGVPLTKTQKLNKFYYPVIIKNVNSMAVLSQLKLVDGKRLVRKVGGVDTETLDLIKEGLIKLLK